MIRSMTGFGRRSYSCPYGKVTAEIKTLNHKTLSVTCNPLNGFFLLEEKIKGLFGKKVFRGKVFVRVTRESTEKQVPLQKITINETAAGEYLKKIKQLQKKMKVPGEISIRDLIAFPGVVETGASGKEETLWPYIKKVTEDAIDSLIRYRKAEGARLAKDFLRRLTAIRKNIKEIKKYEKQSVAEYRKKLVRSIKELSRNAEIDRGRLETEVASFAKNCDIAEEITRLEGHLEAYTDAMKKVKTDVGKKLDFIAQEMHREINTIGAKASDFRISKAVIDVKSEIEKMREQVNNVE